jgi:hypothetical protein
MRTKGREGKSLSVTDFGEGDWGIPTGLVPVESGLTTTNAFG